MNPIIRDIKDADHFKFVLGNNPGLVIVKIGATWCQPCVVSKPLVNAWFEKMPNRVQIVDIDVDKSAAFYSFMKNKKMVSGIPTILCYIRGNVTYIPDEIQVGSSIDKINFFFNQCLELL